MSRMLETNTFATRLGDAIDASGLTLQRLSAKLDAARTPTAVSTLSLWRAGRSQPTHKRSRAAVVQLEQILGLPAGHLASCLEERTTTIREHAQQVGGFEAWPVDEEIKQRLIEEFGQVQAADTIIESRHETVEVDEHGRITTTRASVALLATRPGVHRRVVGTSSYQFEGEPASLLVPTMVHGGMLGKVLYLREQGMSVFEILFSGQPRVGDVILSEYLLADETLLSPARQHRDNSHTLYATTPLPNGIIEARFHEDYLPSRVWATFHGSTDPNSTEQRVEVPLQGTSSVVRVEDMLNGAVVLRWEWDD